MRAISFVSVSRRAAVLMFLLLMATVTYAQITPLGDSYTNTAAPTTNYGAKTLLDVDAATQITYIQFDLSSIPSGYTGSNIAKASLKLYANAVTTAGSFNVDYVNGAWTEGTIDASNAPPPGTTIAASVPVAKSQLHDYIVIDITSALQAWLNGTETNDGIALVANSTFNASFDSKESTTQSHPPELDIVFAGSGGSGITGINTATGSGLQGGGTSGTLNLSLLTSCASGQVLEWNGSAWTCTTVSGSGGGTVTSVGLAAPSTDFIVTGSPVTSSGTLGLGWLVAPDYNNTPGAIVKRDSSGSFAAGTITAASGFNIGTYASSNPFAFGSYSNGNAYDGFAGNATSTGTGNSGFGYSVLAAKTTGANNTASGAYALAANTGGGANTAHGNSALQQNTTGGSNTGIGYFALHSNTTGGYNTAVGMGADVGSGNLSNATAIGANAVVSASNALVLGGTGSNAVSVGIGTAKPGYTLDVQGTGNFTGLVKFVTGQPFPGTGTITGVSGNNGISGGGTSGNVTLGLATNACASGNALTALPFTCSPFATLGANTFTGNQTVSGNLTATQWVSGSGFEIGSAMFGWGDSSKFNAFLGFAGTLSATGTDNTGIGGQALRNLTAGASNTATGFNALYYNTGGSYNTATGNSALQSNTTGNNNTAYGVSALLSNATTNDNTAVGYRALASNTASQNSAFGSGALQSNTTGQGNTASGYQALYDNIGGVSGSGSANTAFGYQALFSNQGNDCCGFGFANVASGYQALYKNTGGSSNTASGYQALYSNTGDTTGLAGNFNTASGITALYSNTLGSENVAVGDSALYRNTGDSNGNGWFNTAIGEGALFYSTMGSSNTAVGGGALEWNVTGSNNTALGSNAGPDSQSTSLTNATAIGANAVVSESNALVLGSSGVKVGIGTATPGNVFTIGQNAGKAIADGWTTYSSRRWKTNIHTLHGALGKVEQLRGVSYDLKANGQHEVGVIAEEVGAVVPEVVTWEKNGKDAQSVDYGRLTALLIEATKEQQKLIHEQQEQIVRLTRQVKTIQATLRENGRSSSAIRTVKAEARTVHQ